jgi:predicted Zn-dependent protease
VSEFDKMAEVLKDGTFDPSELPDLFSENERIVAPMSDSGRIFQLYMERLARKLLPDLPLDDHPIYFYISDKPEQNAYVFASHNPSVMVFTKGLLESFSNEDELAYVLGHELNHLKLTQELGAGENSKLEEYISDNRPLAWMHRAGYDARAALEFTKRQAHIPVTRHWGHYLDVHGLPEFRASVVEKSLALLDKYVGGLHQRPTPINSSRQL